MKAESDNFRQSSVQGIWKELRLGIHIIVFEPELKDSHFFNSPVEKDLGIKARARISYCKHGARS